MDFLTSLFASPDLQLVVPGAFGGVARWILLKVKVWDGAGAVLLGGIMGEYVSPIFQPAAAAALSTAHLDADPARLPPFVAFAVGVLGIALIGYGVDKFNRWQAKQPSTEGPVVPEAKPTDGLGK